MTWLMSVAAGAAIGYFLFHFIISRSEEERDAGAPPRRLHRSRKDRKIAGVCGGLAEYLNTDPTVVRLATVLLMLGWGSGLLAYIICAVVMPEEG